jgi:uncharacterized SAM-binding protein YcdF (DUF218 family)
MLNMFHPVPFTWLCMGYATGFFLWKRRWKMACLWGAPVLFLFMLGSLPWPEALLGNAEKRYLENSIANAPRADAVVMLGGIVESSKYDPQGFAVRDSAERLLAAVELVRQGKGGVLVLGGSGANPANPNESAMSLVQDWIKQWELCKVEVLNLGICGNTHDEAVRLLQLKKERGWQRLTIVTSAFHMKRASAVIQKLNGEVNLVACDFIICGRKSNPWSAFPLPRTKRLELLETYVHEVVGWYVYRWRGWI